MTLVHENRNFQKGTQEEVHGEKPTTYIKKYDDQEAGFCVKCGAWKGQLGLEPTWQLYVSHMVTVCRELKRVLKKTGSMYIVLGDTYAGSGQGHKISEQRETYKKYSPNLNFPFVRPTTKIADYQPKCLLGIPWRVAFALIDDGWILRNDIIWRKPNAMPSSVKDRLTQTYEHIFHFVKNRKYYYNLDAIREPHQTSSLKRAGISGVVPFNLRVRDVKRGKKGAFVEGGKVKQLKASEKEVENYVYPESGRIRGLGDVLAYDSKYAKHEYGQTLQAFVREQTIAKRRQVSRIEAKKLFPNDPEKQQEYINYIHDHDGHPKGKNPGDVFQTKKEPYVGNNPHRMRLQKEQYLALDSSRPMDLSHPKGKNPGDFWNVCTKPFKGAHFAVYPEAICINPILSSCPPNGVVLDPMCGSGTTCLVAKKLGRNYIGIELNPKYVELARKRLEAVPPRLDTFL